ncbi:adenylate/guanylate cyclase domain-containing protein [Rhodoligotrophos defluvii]|uniref:adenylate/guanylate cyclase domain-containing protein n=1 Tax=Rhodoligotrophos defluvii TaxID=2561934 RepID=UPI00148596D9|nr:adenylate/guanylate cyclase domain-containing protein [Rhodoligotrophos defluvii]
MDQKMRNGNARPGWPIGRLLPLVLGALIIAAVVPVIVTGSIGARDISSRLLRERNDLLIEAVVTPIEALLEPVVRQMDRAAALVAGGQIDPADEASFGAFVRGLMAPTPQVAEIALLASDGSLYRWGRDGAVPENGGREPFKPQYLDEARAGGGPRWSRPFHNDLLGETVVTYRAPLRKDGEVVGVLVAAVTVETLSTSLAAIGREFEVTPFVLLDRVNVVAHPAIARNGTGQGAGTGTSRRSRIDSIGDPILAAIWADPFELTASGPLQRADGHWAWIGDEAHVFLYRNIPVVGDGAWLAGYHQSSVTTRRERWMTYTVAGIGAGLLLLALFAAARIGRGLARPIIGFADASAAIERFDFGGIRIERCEASRVQEIASTASAIRRMASALGVFERYVPKALVHQLVALGPGSGRPERRDMTIMFLDLEGYTRFAEGRTAQEVADYLNETFGRIGPVIEESGGAIDKYTGDGLMAFWGAPGRDPDHARKAVDCALRLVELLAPEIEAKRSAGAPACRIRIGLNSGEVVVGDLGYDGRTNYTVIGHAVNVAKRAEEAVRGIAPEVPVMVVVTDETASAAHLADDSYGLERLDRHLWLLRSADQSHSAAAMV